jgi:hypothetical protein
VKDSVETLAIMFRQCGVLAEADIDREDVALSEDIRKDECALYQQPAVLMNSAECVRQCKEYQQHL